MYCLCFYFGLNIYFTHIWEWRNILVPYYSFALSWRLELLFTVRLFSSPTIPYGQVLLKFIDIQSLFFIPTVQKQIYIEDHQFKSSLGFRKRSKPLHMMTSSNGNIFRVTGPLCREFTGRRWIPRKKANDAELWCFLWSAPEYTVE